MLIKTKQGFSIVELLVVLSIMLFITGGTFKLFVPYVLQTQNLVHSQISEGNFRNLISSLNTQACTQTFFGKKIGQSVDQIRDETGIPLFDRIADENFQRNLKIIKIKTAPKKSLCSSIMANSAGDCPPGCLIPASFPGSCSGTDSNSTKGYAKLEVYFSRANSLYEKEDDSLDCSSTDQSGCYKQNCLLKLNGTSLRSGALGASVGDCSVSCAGALPGGGNKDSIANEVKQLLLKEIVSHEWQKSSTITNRRNQACSYTFNAEIPATYKYINKWYKHAYLIAKKDFKFSKVRDVNNNVLIDLKKLSDQKKYGVSKQAYFFIRCTFGCYFNVSFPNHMPFFPAGIPTGVTMSIPQPSSAWYSLYLKDPGLSNDSIIKSEGLNIIRFNVFISNTSYTHPRKFECRTTAPGY